MGLAASMPRAAPVRAYGAARRRLATHQAGGARVVPRRPQSGGPVCAEARGQKPLDKPRWRRYDGPS